MKDGVFIDEIDILKNIVPKGQIFGCSLIQRHLRIGYCKAFALMEKMVADGLASWETETRIVFK